jgi:hypothetical protein
MYVQLASWTLPAWTDGVQLGLGQSACARTSASVGAVELSAGTASRPFLLDVSAALVTVVTASSWASTSWPPLFVHWMVAEYVAARETVALVCPTPASSYVVQLTPVADSVQSMVPVWRCVPEGAFSGKTAAVAGLEKTSSANNATIAVNTVCAARLDVIMGCTPSCSCAMPQ